MKLMKLLILVLYVTVSGCLFQVEAQSKVFATKTGQASFFSETPTENISAANNRVQAVLKPETNEIAVRMKMSEFIFPNKLMQEHFNENYMESTKFPTGTFSGKIDQPIDYAKDGIHEVTATGDFTVHGVKKPRKLNGKLQVRNGKVFIETQFDVALKDHNIDVPTIVFVKIAQIIQVKASVVLE